MMLNEPRDQLHVFRPELKLGAIRACIVHAQLRMIAAATFGNIVKNAGQIEQFALREILHQFAAQRVLM